MYTFYRFLLSVYVYVSVYVSVYVDG